jgi:hypothetical protein
VTFDETSALIVASLVGAGAALLATFVTLVVTRWLDDRRWVREREHRELTARRAAYAKMSRTAAVWREAAVDLMGKPKKRDWEAYWVARDDAMQAGAELELIGSALAIETMGEALEQLLDLWWDYEVNGPSIFESGPLWSRMGYVDRRLDAFRDLARAEFDLEPAREDPRGWLETPELVRRRVKELRIARHQKPPTKVVESAEDAKARKKFEEGLHRAGRAGTIRRLALQNGLSEADATALLDRWEAVAAERGIHRGSRDYWRVGDAWIGERLPADEDSNRDVGNPPE